MRNYQGSIVLHVTIAHQGLPCVHVSIWPEYPRKILSDDLRNFVQATVW